MNILAIIPARGGSKGLPKKNILKLIDKPLIAYTIEEAKKSKYINRIMVSTEDDEIAKISLKYGAEVPFMRPSELAQDTSSTNSVIINVLEEFKTRENYEPDIICVLQCTSPLRKFEDIDGTIEKMLKNNSEGSVSISEARSNPYWTNILDTNERLKYFVEEGKKIKRRQDLPKIYEINGAVYVIKREAFLKYKNIEAEDVSAYLMDEENSLDIDNIIDFKLAEVVLREQLGRGV